MSRRGGHLCNALNFEAEELPANEDHVSGLEFHFPIDPDESAVPAVFIDEDETRAAPDDPSVAAGHESIMRESDVAGRAPHGCLILQIVAVPGLTSLHDQVKFSSNRGRRWR